jgi:hypothetical protein
MKDLQPTLPIACVWQVPSHTAASNAGISIAGTIGVIAGQGIVFILGVWYLHSKRRAWLKWIQAAGILFLFAIGVGAAIRVILLSQAFGNPSVQLNGTGERDWGFGQLLSMLLLLLPLVSAIEIYRGTCITLSHEICRRIRHVRFYKALEKIPGNFAIQFARNFSTLLTRVITAFRLRHRTVVSHFHIRPWFEDNFLTAGHTCSGKKLTLTGEMNVPSPADHGAPVYNESAKLDGQELFQPNPYWGSRSNLVNN